MTEYQPVTLSPAPCPTGRRVTLMSSSLSQPGKGQSQDDIVTCHPEYGSLLSKLKGEALSPASSLSLSGKLCPQL